MAKSVDARKLVVGTQQDEHYYRENRFRVAGQQIEGAISVLGTGRQKWRNT